MKLGLTDEHIEQLAQGEAVEFDIIETPGWNSTIIIEPAGDDIDQYDTYDNVVELAAQRRRSDEVDTDGV